MISNEKLRLGSFFIIAIAVVLFAYSETVGYLMTLWSSESNPAYSHGLLLTLVSGIILVIEWRKNKQYTIKPGIIPVILLILFGLIAFLAALGTIQIVQMLLLIAIIATLFWAVLGFHGAKPFFFPVILMLGAMPIWEVLGPGLQILTAYVVGEVTTLTIIPSMREGMYILIPAGTFEVAAGCSGINYLIVAVIIAALFCYINEINWIKGIFYVAAAMAVSIVANFIRVYIIIVSGQMTNMESYFVTVEHISLGWVIFAVAISLYLWLASRSLATTDVADDRPNQDAQEKLFATSAASAQPLAKHAPYMVLLLVVIVTGPLLKYYYQIKYESSPPVNVMLVSQLDGWVKRAVEDSYRPHFGEGLVTKEAIYSEYDLDHAVYVYINYYYTQTQGKEAVNDLHHLADGKKWRAVSEGHVDINMPGFTDVMEARVVSTAGQHKLVWQWYETNQIRTGNKYWAKYNNIIGFIKGKPEIMVVVIATDILADKATAEATLKRFLEVSKNKLSTY